MATFCEIAASSVGEFVLIVFCLFLIFVFRFGFKRGILLLIVPVPVHCFSITFINFGLLIRTEWNCF